MIDAAQEATQAALPEAPTPKPPSPAAQLQAALDKLNHPSTLDLHARLDAIHNALNVMGTQLVSLLPTE